MTFGQCQAISNLCQEQGPAVVDQRPVAGKVFGRCRGLFDLATCRCQLTLQGTIRWLSKTIWSLINGNDPLIACENSLHTAKDHMIIDRLFGRSSEPLVSATVLPARPTYKPSEVRSVQYTRCRHGG